MRKSLFTVVLVFSAAILLQGDVNISLNEGVKDLVFLTKLEIEVVNELNIARSNPELYAKYTSDFLKFYQGRYIKIPGRITIITNEGTGAVKEAIRFLKKQGKIGVLKISKGMSKAAKDQVEYQGPGGRTGHSGAGGTSPFTRMNKYGSWGVTAGENIDYGNNIAREIVMALIIDDGVSSRGHRKNIFNKSFKVVGVACGIHKRYRHMCVMDFAGSYREKL
jgi:cysteine-rich secretory family protein